MLLQFLRSFCLHTCFTPLVNDFEEFHSRAPGGKKKGWTKPRERKVGLYLVQAAFRCGWARSLRWLVPSIVERSRRSRGATGTARVPPGRRAPGCKGPGELQILAQESL